MSRTPQQLRHAELNRRDRLVRFELRGRADRAAGAPRKPPWTGGIDKETAEAAWLKGFDSR